ncbi:hypothetical protein HMPREF9709_00524 [Helcococcus kunzii ATCC 51366]|uniref:Uncharacterized protein n=1 Tax=Helcococcus kunzii ATCC 51366 TaxID=883114 RepID=H3NMG3_9FIRM|nr:hypothetical protein HMPREF9709_00524 [Helcococcus kunzii ATCC 51366]
MEMNENDPSEIRKIENARAKREKMTLVKS